MRLLGVDSDSDEDEGSHDEDEGELEPIMKRLFVQTLINIKHSMMLYPAKTRNGSSRMANL
jgi:hypothetical protein